MADTERHLNWPLMLGIHSHNVELQTALLYQLEKDFLIDLSNLRIEQILEQIEKCVEEAIHTSRLTELLYRVDLNEAKAHKCLEAEDAVSALAKELLNREAQKVLFRWQYSRGEKP